MSICWVRARLPAVHSLWVLTGGLVAHFADRHPGLCCILCILCILYILCILCILYQLVTLVPTVLCPPRQLDATELCPAQPRPRLTPHSIIISGESCRPAPRLSIYLLQAVKQNIIIWIGSLTT